MYIIIADIAKIEDLSGSVQKSTCQGLDLPDKQAEIQIDRQTDTDLKQKSERQCSAKQLAPSDSQVIGEERKIWAFT